MPAILSPHQSTPWLHHLLSRVTIRVNRLMVTTQQVKEKYNSIHAGSNKLVFFVEVSYT
jgi:hypothetical protein